MKHPAHAHLSSGASNFSFSTFSGLSLPQVPQTNKVDEGGSPHPALCRNRSLCHPRTRGVGRAEAAGSLAESFHHIMLASWTLRGTHGHVRRRAADPRGRYRGLRRGKAPAGGLAVISSAPSGRPNSDRDVGSWILSSVTDSESQQTSEPLSPRSAFSQRTHSLRESLHQNISLNQTNRAGKSSGKKKQE